MIKKEGSVGRWIYQEVDLLGSLLKETIWNPDFEPWSDKDIFLLESVVEFLKKKESRETMAVTTGSHKQ